VADFVCNLEFIIHIEKLFRILLIRIFYTRPRCQRVYRSIIEYVEPNDYVSLRHKWSRCIQKGRRMPRTHFFLLIFLKMHRVRASRLTPKKPK
jgi:hypothetical protein